MRITNLILGLLVSFTLSGITDALAQDERCKRMAFAVL